MHLDRLWLTDFRNYEHAEIKVPESGLIVVSGANGQGKTNLLEAVHYIATQRSFRVAQADAMIRRGADTAVVRAEARRDARELLVESELTTVGRNRMMVNRQPFQRARDQRETLLVTVFAPDDLELVKGGPSERRTYIDALMVDARPSLGRLQSDVDRILRQRNTLLRQGKGRLTPDIASTLDVWDAKFAEAGYRLDQERRSLVESLRPGVQSAYERLVDADHGRQSIGIALQSAWREEDADDTTLAAALAEARANDIARAVTTVGPHRDDIELLINDLPARTHSSQGEQRTLALALRFAGHELITGLVGSAPLLLLDDVFSELDPRRAQLLTEELPHGQVFLATANHLPPAASVAATVHVERGTAA